MTPEQLREAYAATNARMLALHDEEEALEGLEASLDRYARTRGWSLEDITAGLFDQPGSSGPVVGADDAGGVEVALPPTPAAAPNEQPDPGVMEAAGQAAAAREDDALPPDPAAHACPHCPRTFSTEHGLRIHLSRAHSEGLPKAKAPKPPPTNGAADEARDPRVIDDGCRKCGQRFRWSPALTNHERTCRGERKAVAT